ncbi:putative The ARF like 2 binding protein BART [Trypanosoma vivax]|nr:hypothetical protein TRVL_03211 [Trypanosoma vivax]KAH8611741.1 putative The ARF like 2 binding protein BART [Trypanosoma vivax]
MPRKGAEQTEDGWITESIVQFLRSPYWRTPVENFVDDNCYLFTDEEEMKFEQTEIHNSFRQLIDELLTTYVGELGIQSEEVVTALSNSMKSKGPTGALATKFIRHITSVDDFISFYKMMMQRNIELDVLAQKALPKEIVGDDIPQRVEDESDMIVAIEASMREQLESRILMELEDLHIQQVLALSILEEEMRAMQAAGMVTNEAKEQAAATSPQSAEQLKAEKLTAIEEQAAMNIKKLEERAIEVRREAMLQRLTATASAPPTAAEADKPAPAASAPEKAPSPSSAPVCATISSTVAALTSVTTPQPVPTAPTTGILRVDPPEIGKGFGFKKLPRLQPTFKQLEATVTKTGSTALGDGSAGGSGGLSKEEMEARARHMREQRELILRKNRAMREEELKKYKDSHGGDAAASPNQERAKQVTVDLARRLRDDILREATK